MKVVKHSCKTGISGGGLLSGGAWGGSMKMPPYRMGGGELFFRKRGGDLFFVGGSFLG